jgi:hypothetical protein
VLLQLRDPPCPRPQGLVPDTSPFGRLDQCTGHPPWHWLMSLLVAGGGVRRLTPSLFRYHVMPTTVLVGWRQ